MISENGFLNLSEEIRTQFEENGIGEIGDPENFIVREGDRTFVPNSLEYVIGMIDAFDRYLSTLDHATYDMSIKNISELMVDGVGPDGALVFPSEADKRLSFFREPIDLSNTADFEELRGELRNLKRDLKEAYDPDLRP
jgi:hypothetical protein